MFGFSELQGKKPMLLSTAMPN